MTLESALLSLCDGDPDLRIEVVLPPALGRVTKPMNLRMLAKLRRQCAGPDFGGDEVR